MQKESISINTDEKPFYYDATKLLLSSQYTPSEGLYSTTSEFGPEYRINEALKLNAQRLVGLSFKKKKFPATFFTKSQVRDPTSTVFRISYGDDAIPKAAEADYKSSMMKSKPFIPPEYRNYEDKPHQLPLFLKDKLYKTVKSRKNDTTTQEDSIPNPPPGDHLIESHLHTQTQSQFLPSLPSYRHAKQHGISIRDFGRSTNGLTTPVRATDLPDFPYFSPKARQQMKSDSVPVLMSNVFLTGGINPEGLAPQDEAAVEYIVSEYHSKTRPKPPTAKTEYESRTQTNSRSRLTKTAVTMSLAQQNRRKKEWEEVLYKTGNKQGVDKFGTKLKATVGHLKTEREVKRKKVLSLLKTKNFNLFRPNTINNLHLLKDALLKE